MRVARDRAITPREAEVEPEGDLSQTIALRVVEARDRLCSVTLHVVGDQHAPRRQAGVDVRDADVGMGPEAPLEAALMLRLDLVVELVRDPLADLGEHGARVESGREALEDRCDDREAAE